jgi:hypothetical protein
MTRPDTIRCVHEPFGDAFYFGPERLGDRFGRDEPARIASGFSESTFATVFGRLEREASEVEPFLSRPATHPPPPNPASNAPLSMLEQRANEMPNPSPGFPPAIRFGNGMARMCSMRGAVVS